MVYPSLYWLRRQPKRREGMDSEGFVDGIHFSATNCRCGSREDGASDSDKETTTVVRATYTLLLPTSRKTAQAKMLSCATADKRRLPEKSRAWQAVTRITRVRALLGESSPTSEW